MSGFWPGSGIKGNAPHYFRDTNATMTIWKFYAKLVMHAPMWTLKCRKTFWSCDAWAHNSFFYFSQPSVSKICSFINLCIHPSLSWVFEKLFTTFTLQMCTHIFFQKLVMISEFFQRKARSHLFPKACWFLARQLLMDLSLFLLRDIFVASQIHPPSLLLSSLTFVDKITTVYDSSMFNLVSCIL